MIRAAKLRGIFMHFQYKQSPKFAFIVTGFFLVFVLFLVGSASSLSFVGRILFVLFLPGFSILQVTVSDEFDLLEKVVLSPVIGITLASLMTLYLSLTNVQISEPTVIISTLLVSVPLLAYSWKQGWLRKTIFKSSAKATTYLILTLLVVVSIVLIALPIPRNGILLPIGDDPATSTLAATMIVEQGRIPESWAPYFPEQASFTYPPGYPSVLAILYLLDPSCSMPVLASLFAAFFAVIPCQIFILTRRLSNNKVALCSAALSALLPIGFHQMLSYGRFPALFGLTLTLNLLFFSYIYSITGKRKLLLLAGFTLASIFLAYSVSFITATLFVVMFFSFGLIFYKHKKESFLGAATIITTGIAISAPWISNTFNRLLTEIPSREYEALIAWFNTYSLQTKIGLTNIFIYYSYWLFLFAIVGFLVITVRKRISRFLSAWFLSIFLLMLNENIQIHFPGWYYLQSWSFLNPLLSLPLSVLAGISFVKAYELLKERTRNSSLKIFPSKLKSTPIAALALFTVIFGAIIILFWTPALSINLSNLQTNRISTADYNAIMWISKNTPEDAVIFNDHWVGTPSVWIPVISHRRIVMPLLSISEAGWTDKMFTRQDESLIIARDPNSTQALSILERYAVSYIYLSDQHSDQVEEWRNNYDAYKFLQSPHYELAFNEDDAWVIRVIY
jgi:hypothetical protein